MQNVVIEGAARTDLGKKATKAVRDNGLIPCVIYGGEGNKHFTVTENAVRSLIYTPEFKVAEITVDGATHKALVKDIQWHPVTDKLTHIDFIELVDGKTVKCAIPLVLTGQSAGAKKGGVVLQKLRAVKVKTTPEKLVDEINLDISHLDLGQSARVREIKAIDGIEIMINPAVPVATIEIPRSLRSAASKEEASEA